MATFSSPTFSATRYALARPTYPPTLFNVIYDFHASTGGAKWGTAVDVGCGTGQVTRVLRERFARTIGVDPSEGMVRKAAAAQQGAEGLDWKVGDGEKLADVLGGTEGGVVGNVDLVTAGQAAHWFDHGRVWSELRKVVRPGGTVAYWGYGEALLPSHPATRPLLDAFQRGADWLGPHWEQPGRSIVVSLLDPVPFPAREDGWGEGRRVKFLRPGENGGECDGLLMKREMDWGTFEAYLRTFSAVHTYQEQNAGDQERADGDVVSRFLEELTKETGDVGTLEVAWPLGVMLVKRV